MGSITVHAQPGAGHAVAPGTPLPLQVRGLRQTFGSGRGPLRKVDVDLASGESVAILGRSGCGKSVLFEHLLGMFQPEEGEVLLFGQVPMPASEGLSPLEGGRLAFVFQESALLDSLSVRENLTIALEAERDGCVESLLQQVGLGQIDPEGPVDALSGGQKRRLALARAFAMNPSLLVCDEPTSGLDPLTAQEVTMELRRWLRSASGSEPGSRPSLLVITHDYEMAAALADRVYLLHDGVLVEVTPSPWAMEEQPAQAVPILEMDRVVALRRKVLDWTNRPGGDPAGPGTVTEDPLPSSSLPDRWMEATGMVAEVLLDAVRLPPIEDFVRRWRDFVLGSLGLIVPTALLIGMVLVLQLQAGLAPFGFTTRIPAILVDSLVREVGPLFTGLLLAGRIGASAGAELGSMALSWQLEALRMLGRPPRRTLLPSLFWAGVLGFPVLGAAMVACALLGGYLLLALGDLAPMLTPSRYLYDVWEGLSAEPVLVCLAKLALSGGAVSACAWAACSGRKESADQLGRSVTSAVVSSAASVVALDFLVTQISHLLVGPR